MRLNPPGQYADDRNLRARQRLWQHQVALEGGHCLHRDQPERWVTEAHAFAAAITE